MTIRDDRKDPLHIDAARALVPGAFPRAWRVAAAIRIAVAAAFLLLTGWCLVAFDFAPARIIEGLARFGRILAFMFPPEVRLGWPEWLAIAKGMGETVSMALLGTLLGAAVAFPLSFLGARNIMPFSLLRLTVRRGFDTLRAVEQIILALIFIRAFGLGPLAGVFAIAVSEIGILAKLFSEAIENASRKPADGVRASGGGPMQTIRFAIVPQAMPVILSIVLYELESNTRTGTVLGIVGAGGIGFLLSDRIAAHLWGEAWTIILLIVLAVYVIDGISGRLRARLIGATERLAWAP